MFQWMFRPQRTAPERVETDQVVPVFFFDRAPAKNIVSHTLRYPDALDTDAIYAALCRLLEIGGWRKLGGRLRNDGKGGLEIHIPQTFTPQRPAVGRSRVVFDTPIEQHPVASKLPKPSSDGRPSIQPGPYDFASLSYSSDTPTCLDDYLYSDRPQLHLYTIEFSNATIVTIMLPHSAMDAVGQVSLYQAWTHVLAGGDEDQVPAFLSMNRDPLQDLGQSGATTEPWALRKHLQGGFSVLRILFGCLWDAFLGPRVHWKMLVLPDSSIQRLRAEAGCHIPLVDDANGGKKIYISENDVLTAWLTRTLTTCHGDLRDSNRQVIITNNVDMRARLPRIFPHTSRGVYVQNALCQVYHVFSARDFFACSLRNLALRCRADLQAQVTETQIEAQIQVLRSAREKGTLVWLGKPNSIRVFNNSLVKCKPFEILDFRPAVIANSGTADDMTSRINTPGRPDYSASIAIGFDRNHPGLRNLFTVFGKDPKGNVYIGAALYARDWAVLEKEIESI